MKYILTLSLKKYTKEHKFKYLYSATKGEDIQGIKEKVCMDFEEKYGTPIKCMKIEEAKDD